MDFDSYFSSYILSRILRSLNINAIFAILDNYNIGEEDKKKSKGTKTKSNIFGGKNLHRW